MSVVGDICLLLGQGTTVCILCRFDWMFAFAMFMALCVDVMVMSSA